MYSSEFKLAQLKQWSSMGRQQGHGVKQLQGILAYNKATTG